jgi:glyoxylase-like metal-dependent hydrolase (beta-lactamase superfamily II)
VLLDAQAAVKQIGKDLYAYVSDNDSSANSTFLVGRIGILVVDTGLNATEGGKLLSAIRKVSNLPVKFIVNTHYHPDHQGGNEVVGPDATIISTDYTRGRTLALMKAPSMEAFQFRPANLTLEKKITIHMEDQAVEVYFPGKAHTSGDVLVYFPRQRAIAMGDLFLNQSCPAMDNGSVENWIQALDQVLRLPVESTVPGHFAVGTRSDLQRFRDYLSDLYEQVKALKNSGETLEQVRRDIHMNKYSDFRQYSKYEATFSDNAATVYGQLESH